MREPVLVISLSSLEELFKEPAVKNRLKKYAQDESGKNAAALAQEFALCSYSHSIPANFIEIYLSQGGRPYEREKRLTQISEWDIKSVQDCIIECRCDPSLPYKQSRAFVKPITDKNGSQYKILIKLVERMKSLWLEIGATALAHNKKTFYLKYLQTAFRLRSYKKFNVANLLDEGVHSETLSILNQLLSLKQDENKWLTQAFYKEYLTQFDRKSDVHLFVQSGSMYPFYQAGTLLKQVRPDFKKEQLLKLVPVWVTAQKQAFDRINGSRDVKLELGFLCGNGSTERFNILVSELVHKKQEKPVTTHDVTGLKRKRL